MYMLTCVCVHTHTPGMNDLGGMSPATLTGILWTSPLFPPDLTAAFPPTVGPAPMLVLWAGSPGQQLGEGGLGEQMSHSLGGTGSCL